MIGGILGKNWANGFDAPCRTKNIAREIPAIPWYRSPLAHCVVGGFLPFRFDTGGSICSAVRIVFFSLRIESNSRVLFEISNEIE